MAHTLDVVQAEEDVKTSSEEESAEVQITVEGQTGEITD